VPRFSNRDVDKSFAARCDTLEYIFSVLLAVFVMLFYSNGFAKPKSYLYHCPAAKSLSYSDAQGQFTSSYTENNITTQWYEVKTFHNPDLNTLTFVRGIGDSDCVGYSCEIDCVYKVHQKHGDEFMFMGIGAQEYRFYKSASVNWKNGMCDSSKVSDCPYYIVKNQIA